MNAVSIYGYLTLPERHGGGGYGIILTSGIWIDKTDLSIFNLPQKSVSLD
jgi:hypothetical protein